MDSDQRLPAVRRIEITPFHDDDGELQFALQDMLEIAQQPVALSIHGFFVLSQLDGESTYGDIQSSFAEEFGEAISLEQLSEMIDALDGALMLETEHFEQMYEARRAAYCEAEVRDNRGGYPDGTALRQELEAIVADPVEIVVTDCRGLIAPHLDYARGAPCYRAAYGALSQAPPADRYVILGTNHFGRASSVVATAKDFLTPLGRVTTDRRFIQDLETTLGQSLCDYELDHATEHSVELQVQMLQAVLGDRAFSIVPVLCPDPCGETGIRPHDGHGPDLDQFADALVKLLALDDRKTTVIAGADLSHVGQRFGDEAPTTPEFLQRVRTSNESLLGLLGQRREDAFIESISADENATRICSAGCIYAMLRALPGQACRILHYHQAVDMEAETHVTCAAALVGGQ